MTTVLPTFAHHHSRHRGSHIKIEPYHLMAARNFSEPSLSQSLTQITQSRFPWRAMGR
jgi:hypothetical protein